MRTRMLLCALLGAALLTQSSTGLTQEPNKKGEFPLPKGGAKSAPGKAGDLKKYDDVITKDFTTQPGVFAVHRHEEKVYFEIPAGQARPAVPLAGRGRQGTGRPKLGRSRPRQRRPQVRAPRQQDLRLEGRLREAVRRQGRPGGRRGRATDSIIAAYTVECEGKDRSAVVNVSDVVVNSFPDLPISRAAGGAGASVDMSRSYLSDLKAFPTNIEARALVTFRGGGGGGANVPGLPPGVGLGGGRGASPRSSTRASRSCPRRR